MKRMIKQVIYQKMKSITPGELLSLSNEYNIDLTMEQAKQIAAYLHQTELNPLEEKDRMQALKKLAQITNPKTAQKAYRIFQQIIQDKGLSHWF
ncbi:DUF2624 family protein [Pontibacillus litoralis]|nr:DUF2624 family protein [Pontibacillus litoralis]